jgi:uncharacterized protein YbbC (DUF1343 family)
MEQWVYSGVDRLALGAAELPRSARLGLLTNRAARTSSDRWTGTVLLDRGYHLTLLLTPEHGLAVDAAAGAPVSHSQFGGIPVLSLYGADMSPVEGALETVDALVVDLPDVGCRYYTYGWTVREVLKLAARHGKPVYCLDRPNPLDGMAIEGNKPARGYDSAVCASSVPVRHGLTLGELAVWNRHDLGLEVEISVVRVEGWQRPMAWAETGLPWTPPSPAIRSAEATDFYPGTCLIEGTNVSEGRGTEAPFTLVGAPFLDGGWLATVLSDDEALAGASVEPVDFTPQSSKWVGRWCSGVRLTMNDRSEFRPVRAGLALVAALATHPEFAFLPGQFDALAGTGSWRERLMRGMTPAEIAEEWASDEVNFRVEREALLLY